MTIENFTPEELTRAGKALTFARLATYEPTQEELSRARQIIVVSGVFFDFDCFMTDEEVKTLAKTIRFIELQRRISQ